MSEYAQAEDHWPNRCPNLDVIRCRTFGGASPPLGILTTNPKKALVPWVVSVNPLPCKHKAFCIEVSEAMNFESSFYLPETQVIPG